MAGKYIRGALIQFMETFLIPAPNVIVFQYNPETITHSWSQPDGADTPEGVQGNPLAVRGLPGETFSLSIAMDARDMIADGSSVAEGMAKASGIYTRIAALEMLLFPSGGGAAGGLVGSVSASVSIGSDGFSLGAEVSLDIDRSVPQSVAPVVLFVWGPGRIVPVRVTGLTITETLYDEVLNPTHAEANLVLRVLTSDELAVVSGLMGDIARGSYAYTHSLRQVLALANLANSAEGIIGMLPI